MSEKLKVGILYLSEELIKEFITIITTTIAEMLIVVVVPGDLGHKFKVGFIVHHNERPPLLYSRRWNID
jgi:hypothetical protein